MSKQRWLAAAGLALCGLMVASVAVSGGEQPPAKGGAEPVPARKVFTQSVIPLPEETTEPTVSGRVVAKPPRRRRRRRSSSPSTCRPPRQHGRSLPPEWPKAKC